MRVAVIQLANHLVNFGLEHCCLEQVRGFDPVNEVTAHDCLDGTVGVGADRFVNNAKLVAELGRSSGHVHRPEHLFPKPSPDRQQWVIRDVSGFIFRAILQLGAVQVPGNFALVRGNNRFYRRGLVRLLRGNDLADDGLDIGIAELDRDTEPVA